MAKKFYVVWAGRQTGIFTDWSTCKRSVDKFAGARYKSFPTKAEAEAAFGDKPSTTTSKQKKTTIKDSPKSIDSSPIPGNYDVEIYCDGGCDPNPGKAGSGSVVYREGKLVELWYGLYNPNGTNNTAELNALHQSLLRGEKAINEGKTVAIYCDSMYSINCISNWAFAWKAKGWKKRSGEIKNLEMIKEIHSLYERIQSDIQLMHVKAHIGIEGNELADRMTMMAVDRQEANYIQYTDKLNISALLGLRAG